MPEDRFARGAGGFAVVAGAEGVAVKTQSVGETMVGGFRVFLFYVVERLFEFVDGGDRLCDGEEAATPLLEFGRSRSLDGIVKLLVSHCEHNSE